MRVVEERIVEKECFSEEAETDVLEEERNLSRKSAYSKHPLCSYRILLEFF